MKLNIKKLNNDATIPKYGSTYAAGLDISSCIDCEVKPKTRMLIPTGISISWAGNEASKYYLRIAPRSGLSVKNNIDLGAGVVDYDYRGEIFVCFINNDNTNSYKVTKGDKIAQLILTKINIFDEIIEIDEHEKTERGENGFGSTGK